MSDDASTPAPEVPSRYAEDMIKYLLGFEHPVGAFDGVTPEPHRLSNEAIALRIVDTKGQPYEAVWAVVAEILTELELYRLGYDVGYQAGHDQALTDILEQVREARS